MADRSVTFLFVMGVIALVAVVVFVIYLVRQRRNVSVAISPEVPEPSRKVIWLEYFIAGLTLALIVIVGITILFQVYPGEDVTSSSWRTDARSDVFLTIMLLSIGAALLAFIIGVFVRRSTKIVVDPSLAPTSVSSDGMHELPRGSGMLGLLCLLIGFLVFVWIAVERADQYQLMHHLLYPATLGVALVLLFDKATRGWSIKQPGETLREWVFCDAMVFLLFIAFLNLTHHADGENYVSIFWDVVQIATFFLIFWLIDRRITRYRFLVGYLYLTLVPVLLWVWLTVQGQAMSTEADWWDSVWPFFFLGVIFGVVEVIALIATRASGRQAAGGLRDVLFVVLYGILLISAAS